MERELKSSGNKALYLIVVDLREECGGSGHVIASVAEQGFRIMLWLSAAQ